MAKCENQKGKLLYIKDFLEQYTDEDHPASTGEILKYLNSHGIPAERKSIYSDIAQLQALGMDIGLQKGKAVDIIWPVACSNYRN